MTDHPIHMLWAIPRSTSTAFEWMMRMRGDLICFHEPFGEAWYQGDDARWPRLRDDSPRQPGLTTRGQFEMLCEAATKGPVFVKDFPNYTDHLWDDEFLGRFNHSFLIRNPAKVLPSVHKQWDDFLAEEIGFDVQRRLFDLLSERLGAAPPLIDSDDLLADPHGIVEAYCGAIGIDFIPQALSWEPGARNEVLWYDKEETWHATLKDSDGLKPQPRTVGDISQQPEWIKAMHDDALPHYEHLHQFRLRV